MKITKFIGLLSLLVVGTGNAASTILAYTPVGDTVEDKRIILSNSQVARSWSTSLGTNWTKVRLAMRLIMTNSAGASITGTPVFAAGICAGTNNTFQSATCSNFVGIVSTGATWSYSSGPPEQFTGPNFLACTKVGTTVTNFGTWHANPRMNANPSTLNRHLLFVDVTKGAGTNFTVGGFLLNGNSENDATYAQFLTQAENASPSMTSHTAASNPQVPVSEPINGYLDTVCVAWGKTAPVIHICDVYVVKLQ